MLSIEVPASEIFDETRQEFLYPKSQILQLEHSLVSISKWEAKWNKPFLSKEEKTNEQVLDYIKCMTLTQNVNPNVYLALSNDNIKRITNYIDAPMTATWFSKDAPGATNREVITSELIYYWMIACQIPFECQKWHLNRLLTLVKVCSIKNAPPKKMSKSQIMKQNKALNEARRRASGSSG